MELGPAILVVPATTGPPTTLTTISTEITSAITPNAMMNGTHGATLDCSDWRTARYGVVPVTAPPGSAALTALMSALRSLVVALAANRYRSCAWPVPPLPAIAFSSAGRTQPSAVFVTEFAMPAMVSACLPTVIVEPRLPGKFALAERVIWLSFAGQWPCCKVRSSTGPPGEDRPTRFSGVEIVPAACGTGTCAVTLSAANGPATAVTPATFVAAVICAADATDVSTVKARSAPCCDANA